MSTVGSLARALTNTSAASTRSPRKAAIPSRSHHCSTGDALEPYRYCVSAVKGFTVRVAPESGSAESAGCAIVSSISFANMVSDSGPLPTLPAACRTTFWGPPVINAMGSLKGCTSMTSSGLKSSHGSPAYVVSSSGPESPTHLIWPSSTGRQTCFPFGLSGSFGSASPGVNGFPGLCGGSRGLPQ